MSTIVELDVTMPVLSGGFSVKELWSVVLKHRSAVYLGCVVLFSVIYMLFRDEDFSGINNVQNVMKQEMIRRKVQPAVAKADIQTQQKVGEMGEMGDVRIEKFEGSHSGNGSAIVDGVSPMIATFEVAQEKQKSLDSKAEQVAETIEETIQENNLRPPWWIRWFDRLYFSVVTSSTLGYGDIYPEHRGLRGVCMIQIMITIVLILLR